MNSPVMKTEIERHIAEMLETGAIRPSTSAFASPLIMVKKRDLCWQLCIDYRRFNAITTKTRYPLPVIDSLPPLYLQPTKTRPTKTRPTQIGASVDRTPGA